MRFRRRLVAAFVLMAALTAGVLGITSYVLTHHYRTQAFDAQVDHQARLGLLSARRPVTATGFRTLLSDYQERGGFSTVVVQGDLSYSSSADLGVDDLPRHLPSLRTDELTRLDITVHGEPFRVVAGHSDAAEADLYFFFSKHALDSSLASFRDTLAAGWLLAVVVAAAVGTLVARETLNPVRQAADAARDVAEGLLDTRIEVRSADEFGTLAASFNRMAAEVSAQITQLRNAARRERRLSSDVAHELRTPVASIVSAASLLEEDLDQVPTELRRPVELLIAEAKRLHVLILELLELAQLDAGDRPVHLDEMPVRPALQAVIQARASMGPVHLDVEGDPVVRADRMRFGRVMSNLIDNAFEHGGGEVTIEARGSAEQVTIDVLDRGPGVAADLQPIVFDRLAKGDPARTHGGAGLGLAIAKAQAELQGGSLEVAQRDGGGARFRLTLTGRLRHEPQDAEAHRVGEEEDTGREDAAVHGQPR